MILIALHLATLLVFCKGGIDMNHCDMQMNLDPDTDSEFVVSSPGYPYDTYKPGVPYTWCVTVPVNMTVALLCDVFDIPKSDDCKTNALVISSEEEEPRSYCGSKPFQKKSSTNEMIIQLHSSKKSRGGTFSCSVKAETVNKLSSRAIVYENCDCGYINSRPRIVGGVETGVNEFPWMAGLVDARRGAVIVCGASIISSRFVLTADHCLGALILAQTGVVVGEHNVTTGSESSATRLIKAKQFIPYPYYNSDTNQYDIALVELASPVSYTARVGPVCLPFVSRNWDLTGQTVTVLGWGTTEFGGPRSKVLKKANLDLININNCVSTYGNDIEPYTQLCTYRENSDACQYDSGGPLVWYNQNTNRYEIVGLVSYGRGCASGSPSINTKVAPFIQWILDNTQSETYCYKSN